MHSNIEKAVERKRWFQYGGQPFMLRSIGPGKRVKWLRFDTKKLFNFEDKKLIVIDVPYALEIDEDDYNLLMKNRKALT